MFINDTITDEGVISGSLFRYSDSTLFCAYEYVNSVPNDQFPDWFKSKSKADNKKNTT